MRKWWLSLVICIYATAVFSQSSYWQQQVDFNITVALNDKEKTLDAFEAITYTNHSPDTLDYIWFHLWPNAYKSDRTAFSEQLLENGDTRFYFSNEDEKGYINRLDFKINNITATTEDHPLHLDIIKVILPNRLLPEQQVIITTPFHVKLPYNFSRSGYVGDNFQVTQWYPKPAVYDKNGWHEMPYLEQGEFFSEYGNYKVEITLPANYVVAATGNLQNKEEIDWLSSRSTYAWKPIKTKYKVKGTTKTKTQLYPTTSTKFKTLFYEQNNVHDFAFVADKRFIVRMDTCMISTDRKVDLYNFYLDNTEHRWDTAMQTQKRALRFYSNGVGEYPYQTSSVVEGPPVLSGGMEYPTLAIVYPAASQLEFDRNIVHEVGHNWFYSALGSNERDHPWLDEGLNTYLESLYFQNDGINILANNENKFIVSAAHKEDQAINLPSTAFEKRNYFISSYYKTARWLQLTEARIGHERMMQLLQEYWQKNKNHHTSPEDFFSVFGKARDTSVLNKKGYLPGLEPKRYKPVFVPIINPNHLANEYSARQLITIYPAIGFNAYDKFMVGAFVTNLIKPVSHFEYFAAPMYATGSKKFRGLGLVNYRWNPDKHFSQIDAGISGGLFSKDKYVDSSGKTFLSFRKIVPGIRLTFKERSARSTLYRYIQFKNYNIKENSLSFFNDSVFTPTDTLITSKYNTPSTTRIINQLIFSIENFRALYPYLAELKIEQGKGFVRMAFTGNYFFNYSSNSGGVDVRLFGGKFIYTNKRTANSYLYGLNLSAPKGNLDYTYSDYFIGRNDYPFRADGIKWSAAYQQIMIRDGGLKVNTDAQGNVGSSDDWIGALNFSFDIPASVNPFNALPVKIPLKIFADLGTYAAPWKRDNNQDRFLYDAGLQVSLFRSLLNLYIPIVYSPVFKDYYRSILEKKGRFIKTWSFSIDISRVNSKRFTKAASF